MTKGVLREIICALVLGATGIYVYAENKTVVEGRVWNYRLSTPGMSPSEYPGFHFKDSVNIEGKEYAVFRDKDEIEVAYMRETDNRVYLYCGQLSPTHIMTDQETPIPDEILLYDFNLLDNDLFSVFAFGGGIQYNSTIPQYGESQECIVTEVTDTDSEWPLKQIDFCISAEYEGIHNEYIVHNFIEGVGCTEGLLPFPRIQWLCSSFHESYIYLFNVEDENGNIIFDASMLAELERPLSEETTDLFIYDLHGRQISHPQPGSVYIRGGKKFVAK